MKCSRCGKEISEQESYAYQGKAMCEDCLMEIGLHTRQCEPWATYLTGRERTGLTGTEGLTALQQKVYQFIKDRGKATRPQVKKQFKLSEAELDAQLTPLMHSELVKEQKEKGSAYLITIR